MTLARHLHPALLTVGTVLLSRDGTPTPIVRIAREANLTGVKLADGRTFVLDDREPVRVAPDTVGSFSRYDA